MTEQEKFVRSIAARYAINIATPTGPEEAEAAVRARTLIKQLVDNDAARTEAVALQNEAKATRVTATLTIGGQEFTSPPLALDGLSGALSNWLTQAVLRSPALSELSQSMRLVQAADVVGGSIGRDRRACEKFAGKCSELSQRRDIRLKGITDKARHEREMGQPMFDLKGNVASRVPTTPKAAAIEDRKQAFRDLKDVRAQTLDAAPKTVASVSVGGFDASEIEE